MNLFRVRGIRLAVHYSFFLLIALAAENAWLADEGWTGVWFSIAVLLACFVCVVLHELGHSFTAMRFGIGVRRILLLPIGGMAEFDSIPRRPRDEFLVTIAGPAVNFAIAGVLWLVFGLDNFDLLTSGLVSVDVTGFAQVLLVWNLGMGCFNLLPVFPMDGGRIVRALLARRMPYVRATFIAATIGKVLASVGIAGALWLTFVEGRTESAISAALFGFIFLVGELEYRAVKRQAEDEAHWHRLLLAQADAVAAAAK